MSILDVYRALSRPFRRRRMERFRAAARIAPETRILDVGGTEFNWELSPGPGRVTLLNLAPPTAPRPGFEYVVGDATALPYADGEWDICFCNSVIEHLGTWEVQKRAAAELRRIGTMLWVQTPARAFPIEPHLLAPFVHWLPMRLRRRAVRRFTLLGWLNRPSQASIDEMLAELRLLTLREMRELFPDCEIVVERFLGLPKSYIAMRVAPAPAVATDDVPPATVPAVG